MKARLQKLLSQAGLCSRREAERWVLAGRVSVNGVVVSELGAQADPDRDAIAVDDAPLTLPTRSVLIAFHKPKHVMVTKRDPEGRKTVYDLLPEAFQTFKPVGRLDFESEGLLLFTNDGDLQNRILHPRHHFDKRYIVTVAPVPRPAQLEGLRQGTTEFDPIVLSLIDQTDTKARLAFTLHEGKNRQIRRMCEAVGLRVLSLKRIAIGPIELGTLARGDYRSIDPRNVFDE